MYSSEELFKKENSNVYEGKNLKEISFPIGGIGTGSIGLSGRGSLKDFEIFNRPNIDSWFPKTFPIIRIKEEGKEPVCRILEGSLDRPYTPRDGGAMHYIGEGYPHIEIKKFRGEYPFAWIEFHCYKMPLKIQLEAYNPFIPTDPEASGFPAVILRYKIKNISQKPIYVSILWSLLNLVGFDGDEGLKLPADKPFEVRGKFYNEYKESEHLRGIFFGNKDFHKDHPKFGSMMLSTPEKDITYMRHWLRDSWFTSHYNLWNSFKETGRAIESLKKPIRKAEAGAIAISKRIESNMTEFYTFYITWYFPNFVKYWHGLGNENSIEGKPIWKNYYAHLFEDAFDVANKLVQKENELYQETIRYHDALFSTTIPSYVIDAIASNTSILKTTTCLRLPKGTFYGWEGCSATRGSCEGSCTHVWGYQQALPFLFPSLERSMHDANYKYNFMRPDSGALKFRIQLPLGAKGGQLTPCADGQFGGIMHVYREWKICGKDNWLRKIWPDVRRALEYAWEKWDPDKEGYLNDWQHNTYDVDFYGPNPILTCFYLGALKVGAEMARHLGENEKADEYLRIHDKGCKWMDEVLFNGDYYEQIISHKISDVYQFGKGCLTDQLLGQQLGRIAGIKNYLKQDNIKKTLSSIFANNWRAMMLEHENGARSYATNEEPGTLVCTWPKGEKPKIPFPYADEVWTGSEYQFGIHCLLEGLIREGLTVIKSVRDRYDGYGRNPWDEFECGHHYARAMASYGALIALSGFEFDKSKGFLGFSPKINNENFKTFWSLDGVWGTFSQNTKVSRIEVLYGSIHIKKLKISLFKNTKNVKLITPSGDFLIDFDNSGEVNLPKDICLEKFNQLIIQLN